MIDFLKKVDIFGYPIGVHYKGGTSHNTIFGSVLSLLTILWVLLYGAVTLLQTIQHLNLEVSTNRIKADVDEQGPIDLDLYNFRLMIQTIAKKSDGSDDYNYQIPKNMGKFFAE